jgi:death-on-curing protein
MRCLTLNKVLELYSQVMEVTGGLVGIRDVSILESALARPRITYGAEELYPTVVEKASALASSLIEGHPFVDGNKRIGHAAMELFLVLNRHEIQATVDEQEEIILQVASGKLGRGGFTDWLRSHIVEKPASDLNNAA